MGRDPDHPLSLGEVGKCGVSIASLADMEALFDGISLGRRHLVDDHQLARRDDLRDVPGRRRAAGRRLARHLGDHPERHPQGVHRAEGVHLPAAPVDAPHHRHVRVLRPAGCRGGTRFRSAATTSARPARPPSQELAFTLRDGIEYVQYGIDAGLDVDAFAPRISLLLQRAQRLLRGDREVPRRPPHLGQRDARSVRRARRAKPQAALPHADGRRVAHRPAALQQRRPGRHPGAGRRARRHAVAAHQFARRGAGTADGRGGHHRAADPADSRPRERRRQRGRSARRVVLRRGADRRPRARGLRLVRHHRPAGRDGGGHRGGLPAAARSPRAPTGSSRRSSAAKR